MNTPSRQPQVRASAPPLDGRAQQPLLQRNASHTQSLPPQQAANVKASSSALLPNAPNPTNSSHSSSPGHASQHFAAPQFGPGQQNPAPPIQQQQVPAVGFYSARAASTLNGAPDGPAAPVSQFNPHSESPSIRKTVGIDHSRSIPVKRAGMGVTETTITPASGFRDAMPAPPVPARDFVNPSSDMHRRIGAPSGGMPSPTARGGMNGSAYRPPTRRGPIDANANPTIAGGQAQGQSSAAGIKRPPLGDVSNMHPSNTGPQGAGVGDDAKRQRTTGPENIGPPQQSLPGAR